MRQILATILFFSVTLVLSGQGRPAWVDEDFRQMRFPANEYITGFTYGKLADEKNLLEVSTQMKTEAEADLSKKILAKISSLSVSDVSAVSTNGQYREEERFISRSATESDTEVTGVKTDSYYDPSTKMVYAFASVKRTDLSSYCKRKINQELERAENAVGLAGEMATAGKRMSARNKLEDAKQILGSAGFYRNQLLAVDAATDDNLLQNERERALLQRITRLLADLELIATVYVDCRHENRGGKDDAFPSDPDIFYNIIAQAMSENDCIVVSNREEAGYELTIVTSTSQRSDGKGEAAILSYYANVKGSVFNRKTGKKTVDFAIFNDPAVYAAGRTPEEAATKAFKLIALKDMVLEKILPKIKE